MRGWGFPNNRENNREFFRFRFKIIEICPKTLNLLQKQGISRDFLDFAGTFTI
jgi:hypothetical protein